MGELARLVIFPLPDVIPNLKPSHCITHRSFQSVNKPFSMSLDLVQCISDCMICVRSANICSARNVPTRAKSQLHHPFDPR